MLQSHHLTQRDFNPRSPHGERRETLAKIAGVYPISIHAPRTGSDQTATGAERLSNHFNPRSPHGERHAAALEAARIAQISIHAPRTGSDVLALVKSHKRQISIHAPRTGSDYTMTQATLYIGLFQSTLPARGATDGRGCGHRGQGYFNPRSPHGERLVRRQPLCRVLGISIHAPRTGSDIISRQTIFVASRFQSTLPARGATHNRLAVL